VQRVNLIDLRKDEAESGGYFDHVRGIGLAANTLGGVTMKKALLTFILLFFITSTAFGQANGKLQIHFIDVGQGDGAILISPMGETVMFDNGIPGHCDLPISYLQQLGVTKIDYHVASHYHDDHIGCTSKVLAAFPLKIAAFDRGYSYPNDVFDQYLNAIGPTKRKTASADQKITLDTATANPVTIEFAALNGNGIQTTNENDLSVVAVIHFGKFDAVMGGDLSGFDTGSYKDIESSVAGKVKQVEVYKVHHHCSSYSTNDTWLSVVKPKVGIISASGTIGRNHQHPTQDCLERLHKGGVKTYWTEAGGGAEPTPGWDVVGGNILVEVEPNKDEFKIIYNWNRTDTYPVWESTSTVSSTELSYAWSKKSNIYHYAGCRYVSNINPENLEMGSSPPPGKELHQGCPTR
jgi:beta-lactamase superfamily II metal-dependent hydrolase